MLPNKKLSFFNFSLKKLLETETSDLNKAKIKILHFILCFAMLKIFVAVYFAISKNHDYQLYRALIIALVYLIALKFLLYDKKYIKGITHTMLIIGILLIWSIAIVSKETIYVVNLQFMFMTIISSFYLLGTYWGLRYSLLSTVPPLLLLIFKETNLVTIQTNIQPGTFPETTYITILNFITIIYASYMFHRTFQANMKEKEDLNEQLQLSVDKANKLANSKTEFLSSMSHELRTPLNAVIGITDLLLTNTYDKEQEENLKTLKYSGNNLRNIINNVLDFNKLDLNKLQLNNDSTNLHSILTNTYYSLQNEASNKGLKFELNIDDRLKYIDVLVDSTRISQILYNLIGNSIKFTKEGYVSINLSILSEDENNIDLRFSIKDSGIGIDTEHQGVIFEPFEQIHNKNNFGSGGTGLGLSIVRKILNMYDSDIQVQSEKNKGSEFSFEIKLEKPKAFEFDFNREQEEKDLSNITILVAEDNIVNVFLLERLLKKWKCNFEIVSNGKLAIETFIKHNFDVILMDINMPEMDGIEASAYIRNLGDVIKSRVPIIALTATSDEAILQELKTVSINDIIIKPFDSEQLYQKLKLISDNFSTNARVSHL